MASYYTLTFKRDNMKNTVLSGPDGQPVFEVKSPMRLNGHTTTVKHLSAVNPSECAEGSLVATVAHKCFGADTVEFRGETAAIKTWMPKPKMFSSKRLFTDEKHATQYEWKYTNRSYQMLDPNGRQVAAFSPSRMGLFSSSGPRPASLSVAYPEANDAEMLDTIVLTFLVAEQDRRRRQQQARNAAIGAAVS